MPLWLPPTSSQLMANSRVNGKAPSTAHTPATKVEQQTNKQKKYDKTENCINYLIMGNINRRTFHNILLKLTKVSAFTLSRSIFLRFTLWTVGAGRNGRRRGKCGNKMARRIFLGWGEGENGLGEGGFVGDGGCGAGVGAGGEGGGREGGGDLEPK